MFGLFCREFHHPLECLGLLTFSKMERFHHCSFYSHFYFSSLHSESIVIISSVGLIWFSLACFGLVYVFDWLGFILFVCLFAEDWVLLWSSDWPGTCCVLHVGLKLRKSCLHPYPKCWNSKVWIQRWNTQFPKYYIRIDRQRSAQPKLVVFFVYVKYF